MNLGGRWRGKMKRSIFHLAGIFHRLCSWSKGTILTYLFRHQICYDELDILGNWTFRDIYDVGKTPASKLSNSKMDNTFLWIYFLYESNYKGNFDDGLTSLLWWSWTIFSFPTAVAAKTASLTEDSEVTNSPMVWALVSEGITNRWPKSKSTTTRVVRNQDKVQRT